MKSFVNSNGRLITYTEKGMYKYHIDKHVPEIVTLNEEDANCIIKALLELEKLIGNDMHILDKDGNSPGLSLDRLIDQVEGLIYDSNQKRGK